MSEGRRRFEAIWRAIAVVVELDVGNWEERARGEQLRVREWGGIYGPSCCAAAGCSG
jgi:hypothetical protein